MRKYVLQSNNISEIYILNNLQNWLIVAISLQTRVFFVLWACRLKLSGVMPGADTGLRSKGEGGVAAMEEFRTIFKLQLPR